MLHRCAVLTLFGSLASCEQLPKPDEVPGALERALINTSRLTVNDKALVCTKRLDSVDETFSSICTDDTGVSIPYDEMVAAANAEQRSKFGALDPVEEQKFDDLPDDEVWALIWLAEPEFRPYPKDSVDESEREAERRRGMSDTIVDSFVQISYDRLLDFRRTGAPAIKALISRESLESLRWVPEVGRIYAASKPESEEDLYGDLACGVNDVETPTTLWTDTIMLSQAHSLATGAGKKVAVVETYNPSITTGLVIAEYATPGAETDSHSSLTIGVIRATGTTLGGVAPGASIYMGNVVGFPYSDNSPYRDPAEWAMSRGARQVSVAYFVNGTQCDPNPRVTNDYLYDWYALQSPFPLFVGGAGNDGDLQPNCQYVVNKFQNGLVVGSTQQLCTATRSDDVVKASSSWRNPNSPHGDWELPHLVAPGKGVGVIGAGYICTGTSCSAPAVAGVGALIEEESGGLLAAWPEGKRAIIMATADENVMGSQLCTDCFSDQRDGAGLLNAHVAAQVANYANQRAGLASDPYSQKGWATRTVFPSNFSPFSDRTYKVSIPAGKCVRAAATFNSKVTCTYSTMTGTYQCPATPPLQVDLDLYLRCSGTYVDTSLGYDSAYEYIVWQNTGGSTKNCELRLLAASWSDTWADHGIAWTVGECN